MPMGETSSRRDCGKAGWWRWGVVLHNIVSEAMSVGALPSSSFEPAADSLLLFQIVTLGLCTGTFLGSSPLEPSLPIRLPDPCTTSTPPKPPTTP